MESNQVRLKSSDCVIYEEEGKYVLEDNEGNELALSSLVIAVKVADDFGYLNKIYYADWKLADELNLKVIGG